MQSRLVEVDIENRVCKQAEREGWIAAKLANLGSRGWPDRWFFKPGPVIVIIEFKKPGKKPRPLQTYICNMLAELGFNVYPGVDDYSVAMEILRSFDE